MGGCEDALATGLAAPAAAALASSFCDSAACARLGMGGCEEAALGLAVGAAAAGAAAGLPAREGVGVMQFSEGRQQKKEARHTAATANRGGGPAAARKQHYCSKGAPKRLPAVGSCWSL